MRIAIRHELLYTPPAGANHVVLQLLLTPRTGATQTVHGWSVEMPGIGNAGRFTDAYGNAVHLVNQTRPEAPLAIIVEGVVETRDTHGVLGRPAGEPVAALYRRVTALTKADAPYAGGEGESRLDLLHGLMHAVGEQLGLPQAPKQSQTQMQADGAQAQSQGTRQALPPAKDYAHAFIGAARALSIPARFVTGYLLADPADEQGGVHAWAEAYDEALGWIGFDPLLQLCPTERHVRLAVGLDGTGAQAVRAVPAGDGVATTAVSVALAD